MFQPETSIGCVRQLGPGKAGPGFAEHIRQQHVHLNDLLLSPKSQEPPSLTHLSLLTSIACVYLLGPSMGQREDYLDRMPNLSGEED